MVTWNELTLLIARNPSRNAGLESFEVRKGGDVEFVQIAATAAAATATATPVVTATTATVLAAEAAPAAAAAPTLEIEEEELPVPSLPTPKETAKVVVVSAPPPVLQTKVVKAPVAAAPVAAAPPPSRGAPIDPLVLGIEHSDALYVGAPGRTRHAIEIEEAQRLEACLDALYKSQAGRSRGWTKVGLEAMIKPRCASGGDLKELDRAKKPFVWSLLESDKGLAAFLDFVCVAKKIRVAVWNDEARKIVVYPAADAVAAAVGVEGDTAVTPPLYHVDATGRLRDGGSNGDLLAFCDAATPPWTLTPPQSVLHTLSGLTLAELESVASKLGMDTAALPKGKVNQVQEIATYKLRKRLE
jgi:hypothetical protein